MKQPLRQGPGDEQQRQEPRVVDADLDAEKPPDTKAAFDGVLLFMLLR
ncbi:MAG: hypothetical protein ABID87_03575 [Chloroflexota bacterium]